MLAMGFCSIGTSCANKTSPSGTTKSPRIGKKLKIPPTISRKANGIRTRIEDGLRSQPTNLAGPGGSLPSNQAKCRSSSAFSCSLTEFLLNPTEMLTGKAAARRQSVANGGLEIVAASPWVGTSAVIRSFRGSPLGLNPESSDSQREIPGSRQGALRNDGQLLHVIPTRAIKALQLHIGDDPIFGRAGIDAARRQQQADAEIP